MTYKRVSTKTRHNFVPYNGKIADITEADTNKHTLDLAAALGETRKIIGVQITPELIAGTGEFYFYPNEGAKTCAASEYGLNPPMVIIKDGTNRLQYNLTVANDDFDLYCVGYVVET